MAHLSISCSDAAAAAAVGDGFNREEEVHPPFQPQQEHLVLDSASGKEEHATAMENDKEEQEMKEEDQPPSDDALELKKKRVLEEVESSILVPKEELSSLGLGLGIGIMKVIDETALLETVPSCVGNGKPKKQSRRRGGAGGGKKSVVTVNVSAPKKYSRKELEALRFVNVGQQRKFWKSIYARLQSPVAKEYDSLAATHHHQCLPNHKPPPPILSAELMYDTIREWPRYVKVPFPIAKALATPREVLLNKVPFPLPTPNMFNLDEIHTLTTDTVVSKDALTFNDLGIVPHKLRGYPIEFLTSYRKGGPQFGSTISERVSPDAWP